MAQTRKKRRRKHRGTQGGRVDANRRAPRPRSREEAKARARAGRKRPQPAATRRRPGAARSSAALVAAVIFTVLLLLIFQRPIGAALGARRLHARLLHPGRLLHRHDDVARAASGPGSAPAKARVSLDVQMLTVGPSPRTASCCAAKAPAAALIVDPGEEPERDPRRGRGDGSRGRRDPHHPLPLRPHRRGLAGGDDHRRARLLPGDGGAGAGRHHGLRALPGFGPFESYEADETVEGGEALELAGLTIDVIATPGHSPGHVTYSLRGEEAIFSGDVLFQGSVGRVDLPGGDGPTLLRSIRDSGRVPPARDRRSTPVTWASRRSAPSAPPIPSSPSWPGRRGGCPAPAA